MSHFTPLIAVHALCALTVLVLGPVQILRPRRDRAHRRLGRTWAVAMVLTCGSSFVIAPDGFTWLHGLAIFTLVSLTLGVLAIRRGDVRMHRANMIGSYLGTAVAFAFAVLVPQRAIPQLLRSEPVVALGTALAVGAAVAAYSLLMVRLTPADRAPAPHPRPAATPPRA